MLSQSRLLWLCFLVCLRPVRFIACGPVYYHKCGVPLGAPRRCFYISLVKENNHEMSQLRI